MIEEISETMFLVDEEGDDDRMLPRDGGAPSVAENETEGGHVNSGILIIDAICVPADCTSCRSGIMRQGEEIDEGHTGPLMERVRTSRRKQNKVAYLSEDSKVEIPGSEQAEGKATNKIRKELRC